ncbi:shikimate dehydrogenase [Microbacterium sp. AG1240]|uniref:shikimate dehydrogenase n=1 Tax=Microbacterium sp. AG1240 TaxID=2183992 RepID=UPI000EAC2658|nr:shikimate dehydrogenase [Microbacterium sp. AG1240]RKT37010.1 shikimate dehydrogenase [Microbacterium sp. AG1240]
MLTGTKLAVWGDPVAHSMSPRLHAAAYRVLGLDWEYDRRQVDEASFDDVLAGLDDGWRGLSLTMPLKRAAAASARSLDERARLTGAVNTLLLTEGGPHGFNTDVGGLVATIQEQGVDEVPYGRILGAGATAGSALVALAELGARRVDVIARRPEAAAPLVALGEALGVDVEPAGFTRAPAPDATVTVAALPGGTDIGESARPFAALGGLLVDVVYGSWPTPLATAWERGGGLAISGLGMLLHQAVLQVRVFVSGSTGTELTDEPRVLAAMREAVMGD